MNEHHEAHTRKRTGVFAKIRTNFLAGVVVIAPIGLTVWLIGTLVEWIDSVVLPFVPQQFRPEQYIGINLHGVGVIIFLIFTIIVGWLAKGLFGRSLLSLGERIVDRMPVIRSIYNGLKQIAETVFAQSETSFDRACLVEYPRKGVWAIAFISTTAKDEIAEAVPTGDDIMSVFLPTTPNPTSGFLLFLSKRDLILLDMKVEDAAKLVISAGLVYPSKKETTVVPQAPAISKTG